MKKRFLFYGTALLLLLLFIAGCGKKETDLPTAPTNGQTAEAREKERIDLTDMSSTMIYAEVYNMMVSPDAYLGKTIKIEGPYYPSYYEGTGKYYHYVIVEDATACCSQGLEFSWQGLHLYPEDYPEEGERIILEGVYKSYEEEGKIYYHIVTDDYTVK